MQEPDFPGKADLPKVCQVCGEKPPDGYWEGVKQGIGVCAKCGVEVLPRLIADSLVGASLVIAGKVALDEEKVQAAWAKAEFYFRRSLIRAGVDIQPK
jgi:hypothetical protein